MTIFGYIGPGGGLAISVSLVALLMALVGAVLVFVTWPLSSLIALLRGRRLRFRYGFRKAVVLGLDGLDPKITRRLIDAGKLPHMARLAESGTFEELETTWPAITPSAWPSFMTGNDASRHNIYDFITRDPKTYLPCLSSFDIVEPRRRIRIGRRTIPLGRPRARMLRKGTPFWRALGRSGASVTVLRVPITFPPEPFRGRLLSGMCVPDLLGSQGVSTLFTTADGVTPEGDCRVVRLRFASAVAHADIHGPPHPWRKDAGPLTRRLTIRFTRRDVLRITVGDERFQLKAGQQSGWVSVTFRAGLLTVRGQAMFRLVSTQPYVNLYMTAVQITPERPAMKISHPGIYADYLAKRIGPYGTLGLLEDTASLNDGLVDEQAFLDQARVLYQERKAMFFRALDNKADDLTVCVFDTPDRVQHMFWRYAEPDHPARPKDHNGHFDDTLERLYIEMDNLVGESMRRLPRRAMLLVISDHGFTSFRRGVDLNAWLHRHGYLHLQTPHTTSGPWLEHVDWSRTRAYALGLTGIYVNLRGREAQGIVEKGEELESLLAELRSGLEALCDDGVADPDGSPRPAVRRVCVVRDEMDGPYRFEGPDLLIGYEAGYRCSWRCAKGEVTDEIFADNVRAWSGDHCVDPALVPGVLLTNARLAAANPRLMDIAPTMLDLFGVEPEAPMQGRSLLRPVTGGDPQPTAQRPARSPVQPREAVAREGEAR